MKLETTPTSELLEELRKREQFENYSVDPLPGPAPHFPTRWGIRRDGEFKNGARGPVPEYRAVCIREEDATFICRFLNEHAEARRAASKA